MIVIRFAHGWNAPAWDAVMYLVDGLARRTVSPISAPQNDWRRVRGSGGRRGLAGLAGADLVRRRLDRCDCRAGLTDLRHPVDHRAVGTAIT